MQYLTKPGLTLCCRPRCTDQCSISIGCVSKNEDIVLISGFFKPGQNWLLCLPFVLLAALPARAQDLGTISPGDQLTLPLNVTQLDGEIAIEIDAIDVTELAAIVNGQIVLDLGGTLNSGSHEVTLYLFKGDSYRILETYSFELSGGSGGGLFSYGAQATHEVEGRRVNSENELEGSSSGQVSLQTRDESFSGYVGYIASSREEEQIDNKSLNVTEYALRFQHDLGESRVSATLGHQTLDFDPVLVDSLNRRGLGLTFTSRDEIFRADLFSLQTQSTLGVENFTGLQDRDDRMQGARLALRPFKRADLIFSAQVYEGAGALFGDSIVGEGSGYSFGFDGSLRDGRVRFGAHYGRVWWDDDGDGPVENVTGDAVNAFAEYDLLSGEETNRQLTVGLTYDVVDADFVSLTNPGLPVGHQTFAFSANYTANKLYLGFLARTQETNFGGPDELETDRITRLQFDGTYDFDPVLSFETTTLSFFAYSEWQRRLDTPPMALPNFDYLDTGFDVRLDLSTALTQVSVGYGLDSLNDQNQFNEDELRHRVNLSLDTQATEALYISLAAGSEWVDGAFDDFWVHDVTLRADYQTNFDWLFGLELSTTQTNSIFSEDGFFAHLEASRPIGKFGELVLYGTWADDFLAVESGNTHDAIIGFIFRANTNFGR